MVDVLSKVIFSPAADLGTQLVSLFAVNLCVLRVFVVKFLLVYLIISSGRPL